MGSLEEKLTDDHSRVSVAVLMTCHNRRDVTVRSIQALQRASTNVSLRVFLVDDGSSDGTADAVHAADADVNIIAGSGSLYWNHGMRLAWEHALKSTPDLYLWLNDDLTLMPGSIDQLLAVHREHTRACSGRVIVVGKTLALLNDDVTYGGLVSSGGLSRLRWRRLHAGERFCDTFNGNCVLIPATAVNDVGINSARYRHSLGDIDYGLRASKAGYLLVESPLPVGRQAQDVGLYSGKRILLNGHSLMRVLFHPKGIPIVEWWTFCRQYGGPLWWVNFTMRYVKTFLSSAPSL